MTTQAFEDFYALLAVDVSATPEDIRQAFRAKIREWHPDVNPASDATAHTQRLIVAYKILNDPESRTRYDTEYLKRYSRRTPRESVNASTRKDARRETATSATGPDFSDPVLERWINIARREAKEEWRQFASEFKGASTAALGAVAGPFVIMVIFAFIAFIVTRFL